MLRAREREEGKDVRLKGELERGSELTTTEGSEDEHGDDGRSVIVVRLSPRHSPNEPKITTSQVQFNPLDPRIIAH